MKFYEKLIFLRKQKGLSQEELANELDVSRQTVYKWEAGLNMPDMPKLELLTKYFNVSYNYLLDEKIDTPQAEEKSTSPTAQKPKFRDVFVSGTKLDYDQSGYEHGYVPNSKRKIKNSDSIFEEKKNKLKEYMRKKGYTNVVFLQHDLCLCYFENSKNKTFGFYFNGAEQFVCPFENFIDVHITNDGYSMSYNKRTSVVGLGFGDVSSVSVGSMPQASLDKPKYFTLTIVYFNKNGDHKEYKLDLTSNKLYYFLEHKKADDAVLFMDCLSRITSRGLNDVSTKLMGIKGQRELIKAGEFENINVTQLKQETERIRIQDLQDKANMLEEFKSKTKKRRKVIAITVAAVAFVIALIIFLSNS